MVDDDGNPRRPLDVTSSLGGPASPGRQSYALVPPMRVRVIGGPDAGAVCASSGEEITIGTHDRADLVLTDGTVSRFHCQVRCENGRITIRDLESRNGTIVDGVSVLSAHLAAGATIVIGRSQLRFELGDEPVQMPVAASDRFGTMVGRSVAMRAAFSRLARAAASDSTVLLEGETGTGKEAAAESIHLESRRKDGPFVVVDCGAIPPNLLESELFGHEKGAFTGAVSARKGAFETALGGTVFLDEIGELAPELQPRLLRVLERKEIKRVGANQYAPVYVRVVAATNRSLRSEVNSRGFRSDLYYRLAVIEVRLPALRERREDLPLLIDHTVDRLGLADHPAVGIVRTPEFLAELERHLWPGNVRELRNYIERTIALAEPAPLDAGQPGADGEREPAMIDLAESFKQARESWNREFERRYLEELMAQHGGNVSAAARRAGIDRKYLYRLLWRHGLR